MGTESVAQGRKYKERERIAKDGLKGERRGVDGQNGERREGGETDAWDGLGEGIGGVDSREVESERGREGEEFG